MMQDFRQIKVWGKAHALTLSIYEITARFPADERFDLTSQIRRAAISVGANLAEGAGRGTDADFARFVQLAMGSASEVESLLLVARDLHFIPDTRHAELEAGITEVKRMLAAFLKKLRAEG